MISSVVLMVLASTSARATANALVIANTQVTASALETGTLPATLTACGLVTEDAEVESYSHHSFLLRERSRAMVSLPWLNGPWSALPARAADSHLRLNLYLTSIDSPQHAMMGPLVSLLSQTTALETTCNDG